MCISTLPSGCLSRFTEFAGNGQDHLVVFNEHRRGSGKSVAISERCGVQQNLSAGGKVGQDRSCVLFLALGGETERKVSLIRL